MSKGYLAVIASQKVQAEQRDRVDQHHGRLQYTVITQYEWQGGSEGNYDQDADQSPSVPACEDVLAKVEGFGFTRHRHTRVGSARPNSPAGLNRRIPTIITSARVSF